jgi:hypothetical protein
LDAFVQKQPTTSDEWTSTDYNSFLDRFLSPPSLRDDTFIEISSYGPAAGKTALINLIVAHAILPPDYKGVQLFGRNGTVVLFDNDDRFDTTRAFTIIKAYVKRRWLEAVSEQGEQAQEEASMEIELETTKPTLDLTEDEVDTLARKCLQHVHIFRPQSWSSLITCIDTLPTYLLSDQPTHKSRTRAVSSIIVDGMGAFYWQRRAEEESRKVAGLEIPAQSTQASPNAGHEGLISRLRNLGRRFECPIIVTTLQQSRTSQNLNQHGNIAGANIHITVERAPVRLFPSCISFTEAAELQPMRKQEVGKHQFRASHGNVSFTFIITDDDIIVKADREE